MNNEQLYIDVIEAYFVLKFSREEIVEMYKHKLKKYKHQTHDGKLMFTSPLNAVDQIIECEKQAHLQALNFN